IKVARVLSKNTKIKSTLRLRFSQKLKIPISARDTIPIAKLACRFTQTTKKNGKKKRHLSHTFWLRTRVKKIAQKSQVTTCGRTPKYGKIIPNPRTKETSQKVLLPSPPLHAG